MRRVPFWAFALGLSVVVFYVFLRDPGLNTNDRAMFLDLVQGRAHRPFVYRILVPGSVRLIAAALPDRLAARADAWAAGAPQLSVAWEKARLEPGHAVEHVAGLALMFAALPLFAGATRATVLALVPGRPGFADVAGLAALGSVPAFFRYTSYPSDLPTLALFALAIRWHVAGRRRAFLVACTLAALNKESALLLAVWVAAAARGASGAARREARRLVAAQLAILAAIKLALAVAFAGNPGGFVEVHLLRHNREQLHAFALTPVLVALGAAVLAARDWPVKPALVRAMVWPLGALAGFNLVFAWVEERRVWLEAWPFLVVLLAEGAARALGYLPAGSAGRGGSGAEQAGTPLAS